VGGGREKENQVPQERSEAVVLRGVDFSETSRIMTLLLPTRGRMACMAKGARRKGSAFGGALDTLNRIEAIYYWKDGRDVQQLGEASLLESYGGIKADLEKSAYSSFPLEVAYRIAHENEPSQELFSTLVGGLESLERWEHSPRAHACWQVIQLLISAGFEPSLEVCVDCGRPVSGAAGFAYRGGATCGGCAADRRLTPGELDDLRAMAANRLSCPAADAPPSLFKLLRAYAAQQLETDFRSARVIEEMFGS
jgi:DNA repair protein RecO (recombination protein O)